MLHSLLEWGDKWVVDSPPVTIRHHNHQLQARTVCATCGERVHQRDIHRTSNVTDWDMAGPVGR